MRFSHSKLSVILSSPMEYYLCYEEGINPKETKKALSIGSAFHWGAEHDTYDLSEYYKELGMSDLTVNQEQILAECMDYGYLLRKQEILDKLLNGANIINQWHEVEFYVPIKSYLFKDDNEFHGIIDWLILTDRGFIIIDYKTSTRTPNFEGYLDQIYRYIYLVNMKYPDTPIYNIAIINVIKSGTGLKYGENKDSYIKRLRREYEIDKGLVNLHIFEPEKLNKKLIDSYLTNLARMCDTARSIVENKAWYINFGSINDYGGNKYKHIYLKDECAEVFYTISDYYVDEDDNECNVRDCIALDMKVLEHTNVLNKYSKFKEVVLNNIDNMQLEELMTFIKTNYLTDDNLLQVYLRTLKYELRKSK